MLARNRLAASGAGSIGDAARCSVPQFNEDDLHLDVLLWPGVRARMKPAEAKRVPKTAIPARGARRPRQRVADGGGGVGDEDFKPGSTTVTTSFAPPPRVPRRRRTS